jgi:hypothetical protein
MDMRKRSDTLTRVLISENKIYIRFSYKKSMENMYTKNLQDW